MIVDSSWSGAIVNLGSVVDHPMAEDHPAVDHPAVVDQAVGVVAAAGKK